MKITFLGSSHGVPEPHRRCASILIEVGENRYFVDMGTQSIEKLIDRKISIDSVKAIFITHMHGDHTDGLFSFIDLCNWYYKSANPKIFLPIDAQRVRHVFADWIGCNGNTLRDFDFLQYDAGLVYDDSIIRITAYKTKHTENSHAFLLEAEGKRVLFSGDLFRDPSQDFPVQALEKPLDLAICECAHFEATAYLPFLEGNPNLKKLCFNHYSDRFFPSVLEVEKKLGAFHATDDMEIIL